MPFYSFYLTQNRTQSLFVLTSLYFEQVICLKSFQIPHRLAADALSIMKCADKKTYLVMCWKHCYVPNHDKCNRIEWRQKKSRKWVFRLLFCTGRVWACFSIRENERGFIDRMRDVCNTMLMLLQAANYTVPCHLCRSVSLGMGGGVKMSMRFENQLYRGAGI